MDIFCSRCGSTLMQAAQFCDRCGSPAHQSSAPTKVGIPVTTPRKKTWASKVIVCFIGVACLLWLMGYSKELSRRAGMNGIYQAETSDGSFTLTYWKDGTYQLIFPDGPTKPCQYHLVGNSINMFPQQQIAPATAPSSDSKDNRADEIVDTLLASQDVQQAQVSDDHNTVRWMTMTFHRIGDPTSSPLPVESASAARASPLATTPPNNDDDNVNPNPNPYTANAK